MLASFGSLVLSYVTTASGGAASPGLGGQRTPRGKGKGKDMGITTSGLTQYSLARPPGKKYLFPGNSKNDLSNPRDLATVQEREKCCPELVSMMKLTISKPKLWLKAS